MENDIENDARGQEYSDLAKAHSETCSEQENERRRENGRKENVSGFVLLRAVSPPWWKKKEKDQSDA